MNNRFEFMKDDAQRIKNNDLDCKSCVFLYPDREVDCVMYHQKPLSVLDGKECKKKKIANV